MKFNAGLALLAASLAAVSASPLAFNDEEQITVPIQVPFLSQEPKFLTFPNWFASSSDDGDICPDLPVQCVKKDGEVVGDIGKQPFERNGLTCKIRDPKKCTAECNAKFLVDCHATCTARGPLGGKAQQAQKIVDDIKNRVNQALDGDEDDICPDMKVYCKKDGKTVGDLGKKPFCREGVTCGQCHQTENTAACNAKFLKDCAAQCEATGPLGGKSVFTYLY